VTDGRERTTPEYVHGTSQAERDQLLAQAAVLAPEAGQLLDQLGIQPGWRAIDVGCGPIGVLDLLAERVGVEGTVIGLEPQPRLLEVARSVAEERHPRTCNSWKGRPEPRSYSPARSTWRTRAFSWSFYIGRRLPGLLRTAGLEEVGVRAFTQVYRSGDPRQTQLC
jgi:hypothetical protein